MNEILPSETFTHQDCDKPITQTHVQNARPLSNFELGSTTILPDETLTHQDCDETHHRKT
jgi:hypothetical protein